MVAGFQWDGKRCARTSQKPSEGSEYLLEDFFDISLADDRVVAFHAGHPMYIIPKVTKIVEITVELFASYGLQLSFDAGKTEVMLEIRGTSSQAVLRRLYNDHDGTLLVQTKDHGEVTVTACRQYKHLGTWQGKRTAADRCEL